MKLKLFNQVYFQIYGIEFDQSKELSNYMTTFAKNYKFHPKFKQGIWSGKISFYDHALQIFPIGLLSVFIKFCEDFQYEYSFGFNPQSILYDNTLKNKELNSFYKEIFNNVKMDGKPLELRYYQKEAIENILKNKKCTIESATGSGKSLLIYTTIRYIKNRCDIEVENYNKSLVKKNKILLVVPNVSLVEQMYSDFKSYGYTNIEKDVDVLYNGKQLSNKQILISTWQSIHKKSGDFFEQFYAILVDEVHGLGSSASIQKIVKKCINSHYRVGFTGTLPNEEIDQYNIFGYLGPCVYRLNSSTLIDKGILSKILIVNLILQYPKEVKDVLKKKKYDEEVSFIATHQERNKVFDYILSKQKEPKNTLILCTRIFHLKDIVKYLENKYSHKYKILTIHGSVGVERREKIRKLMEKRNDILLVATYATLSTGINIRNLHHVVFASSYKSKIKVLQSIGRGLRSNKNKNKMVLWDIVDDFTYIKRTKKRFLNYTFKHWLLRLKYYKDQKFKYVNKKINI